MMALACGAEKVECDRIAALPSHAHSGEESRREEPEATDDMYID